MRISDSERQDILELAAECFGEGTRVILFGSRADDSRHGGDIDLHIVAGDPDRASLKDEFLFLDKLEDRIGERRVDVILRCDQDLQHPIDEVALERGIPL